MRSFLLSAVSAVGFLLLLCALSSAPAAAQSECTTTYNCEGNSGCASVMGGNITHRNITDYKDQASCETAARQIMASEPVPSITCSCGGSGTSSSDLGGQMGQLFATMSPQQQMGTAVGAVGTLMILKGLSEMMSGPPVDPAVQQRALAAQQLNNSGIYLLKQKNYAGAINEFQQALAQTPNDTTIKNNLALAKQQQANVALAGKTSGTLGQVLGTPQPSAGPAGSNSPLGLVNLNASDSSANAAQPQGETQSVENQIDGALGNAPVQAAPAPVQQIDQLFASSQPTPDESQVHAEQNQVDDLFKNSGGTTPDAAALAQQASLGQAATAAKTNEDASAMAGQGFDMAAPSVAVTPASAAPQTSAPQANAQQASAPQAADGAASQAPVGAAPVATASPAVSSDAVVADLKTPPAPAPEYAITPMPERVSGFAAPGAPVFDCAGDRTIIKRLGSGLAAQDDAIRRTEAAMKAAEENSADAQKEAMFAAVSTLLSSATTATDWAQRGMAKASASSMELEERKEVIEAMQQVVDYGEKLNKLASEQEASDLKPGESNLSHAADMLSTAKTLTAKMQVAQKFLKDTELDDVLLEKGATTGAAFVAGPMGAAVVETLIHAVDLLTSAGQAWNSAGEAELAEHNLEVMRDEQQRIRSRSYELQQEVVTDCANVKTAGR